MNVMIDTVHNAIGQIRRWGGRAGGAEQGGRSRAKEGRAEQSKGVEQNSG
jgi:hypothetical protein